MKQKPADGLGAQTRRLLELLDGDVEAIYRTEHPFYAPRFTPIMKALADGTPLTIKEIAARSSVSHSAASQTIARMVELRLVKLIAGEDRRSRLVDLSAQGRDLLPWLRGRWRATKKAADELDASLTHPLSDTLAEAITALEERSFRERITSQIDEQED